MKAGRPSASVKNIKDYFYYSQRWCKSQPEKLLKVSHQNLIEILVSKETSAHLAALRVSLKIPLALGAAAPRLDWLGRRRA
jgi:hypothetical protein